MHNVVFSPRFVGVLGCLREGRSVRQPYENFKHFGCFIATASQNSSFQSATSSSHERYWHLSQNKPQIWRTTLQLEAGALSSLSRFATTAAAEGVEDAPDDDRLERRKGPP
jgi:hypothetical protein